MAALCGLAVDLSRITPVPVTPVLCVGLLSSSLLMRRSRVLPLLCPALWSLPAMYVAGSFDPYVLLGLGAGGLVRAYTQSAKDALDAAGISVVRRWVEAELRVPYSLFERARQETEAAGGLVDGAEYGADVTLRVLLPEEKATGFTDRITELTAGGVVPAVTGESFKDVPRAGII